MSLENKGTVCIIDDDEAVRESLRVLLFAQGYRSTTFASADEYLEAGAPAEFDCLLLDLRMPGMTGMELQDELIRRNIQLPIIFISGHGDIPQAVTAIQRGAADFLTKPFQSGELLEKVDAVVASHKERCAQQAEKNQINAKIDSLTPREKDVMQCMVQGFANKRIADELGISPRTVEIHRAHVMEKLEADSLASLVRMITVLES